MLTMYAKLLKMKAMNLVKSEKGQGLVEYALIIALISIAAVAAMIALGADISTMFGTVGANLK